MTGDLYEGHVFGGHAAIMHTICGCVGFNKISKCLHKAAIFKKIKGLMKSHFLIAGWGCNQIH